MIREIPVNESETEKIRRIDNSIHKHSTDLGQAALKVRSIEGQLAGLYDARNKFLHEKVMESGVDMAKIRSFGVSLDSENPLLSKVIVEFEDSAEQTPE